MWPKDVRDFFTERGISWFAIWWRFKINSWFPRDPWILWDHVEPIVSTGGVRAYVEDKVMMFVDVDDRVEIPFF